MSIVINTTTLRNCSDELKQHKQYYTNKKNTFSRNSFGSCSTLSNYLTKIRNIYDDISKNIKNIDDYLQDYYEDVESFEKQMSGRYGYVKADGVNDLLNKYKGTIKNIEIDSSNIFQITSFSSGNASSNYEDVDPLLGALANVAVCGFSFFEGVVNVAEMLGDGVMLVGSGLCSLVGADGTAAAIGNVIEADWSKDLYYWAVEATGLDQYADPNSTAANIFSIAGNIAGIVGLSIVTGGASTSIFGTGTTSATVFNVGTRAVTGAAMNAGSESEQALQQGATIEEAEAIGGIAAVAGAVTEGVTGKFDDVLRTLGATTGSIGFGTMCKYALASVGVGSSESVINEIAHTAIYKNDGESGLLENFLNNASNDGLLFQMFLSGGTSSLGTVGNAIGGIKTYNNFYNQVSDALIGAKEGIEIITEANNINNPEDNLLKLDSLSIGDSLKNIIFGGASKISDIFKNAINFTHAGDIAFENINRSIDDIMKIKTINSIPTFFDIPQVVNIFLGRLRYVDVTGDLDFSKKIISEGLYHFTDIASAKKIVDSSYVKASSILSSYGSKKSFFFAGIPSFEDIAINIDNFQTKKIAVKFDIDESEISKFKFRDWDDKVVTHAGNYEFDSQKAKIVYLGLVEENGTLVYKEITEQQYNNFESNISTTLINKNIRNLQSLVIGYAKQHEYAMQRLQTLKNKIESFLKLNKHVTNDDINLQEYINKLESLVYSKGLTLKDLSTSKSSSILSQETQIEADKFASAIRQRAEIQEPSITRDLKNFESRVAKLVGLEYNLKGKDSISRKIISDSSVERISLEEAATKIGDSVRYTYVIDDDQYIDEMQKILNNLVLKGYKVLKFKNFWGSQIYQGVNTSLISPEGLIMEVQFHTPSSFDTKENLNHIYYEIYRNTTNDNIETEKTLAKQIMTINQSRVNIPKNIINYKYKEVN